VDPSGESTASVAMPVVSIHHRTTYRYRNAVAFGEHRMMFLPLQGFDQRVLSAEVEISPEPSLLRHIYDVSGAGVSIARFAARSDGLTFETRVRLEHEPHPVLDLESDDASVGPGLFHYAPPEAAELRGSTAPGQESTFVEAWARGFVRPLGRTRLSTVLTEMTHAIRSDFTYCLRLQGAPQSAEQTLTNRQGSCRDFAVLLIEAARSLGLAARFVSGYIYSASPKTRTGSGHTHAWARVYVPGCGWVDLDPTNGILGNTDLIRVVAVNDPGQALPLRGTWSGMPSDYLGMDVAVDVTVEDAVTRSAATDRRAEAR